MQERKTTSLRMAAIRHSGTSVELAFRRVLRHKGLLGYRTNFRGLPGAPDVAFTRWRVAIFIDGAFWHGHPRKFSEEKMSDYWRDKIDRNRRRDQRVSDELRALGWTVLRFWDFEIEGDLERVTATVCHVLQRAGRALSNEK